MLVNYHLRGCPAIFPSFSVPSSSLWLELRKKHHRGAQGAAKRGRSNARSAPAGKFSCLVQYRKGARGGRHQEAVAAARQAIDIFRVRMWMAAGHVVLFADGENPIDFFGHHRVLVIT